MIDMYVWVQEEEGEEKTNYKNFQKRVLQPPSIKEPRCCHSGQKETEMELLLLFCRRKLHHTLWVCVTAGSHCTDCMYCTRRSKDLRNQNDLIYTVVYFQLNQYV